MRLTLPALSLSLMTSVLFLVSCAEHMKVPVIEPGGTELPSLEATAVLKQLKDQDSSINSLRALAEVGVSEKENTAHFRQAIVALRPDKLRLETFPDTSFITLYLVAAKEGSAVMLEPGEGRALTSKDPAVLLRETYKLPLTVRNLISILLGRMPSEELKDVAASGVIFDPSRGSFFLITQKGGTFWEIDRGTMLVKHIQYLKKDGSGVKLDVQIADPVQTAEFIVPSTILVNVPDSDLLIELRLEQEKINQAINENLFDVAIPEEYSVHELD